MDESLRNRSVVHMALKALTFVPKSTSSGSPGSTSHSTEECEGLRATLHCVYLSLPDPCACVRM